MNLSEPIFYPGAAKFMIETSRSQRVQSALMTIAALDAIHFGPDPKGVAELLPDLEQHWARPEKHTEPTPAHPILNPYYDGTTGTVDWDKAEHNASSRLHKHLSAKDARSKSKH